MNAVGADYELPPEKQEALERAKRVEWVFIAFLISIILLMAAVMGSSQTMKAMWIEDTLSLVPSCSFLVGVYFRRKPPDEAFPYGYRRAVLVGFMSGAVTLLGFGLYLLGDSAVKLATAEHPIVQTVHLFNRGIWLGWLMIAALIYSVIPPLILGRMKLPLAAELNDKTLHVSAELNKGDWLSGIAGVVGILGIAYGFWWTDAAAAAFISFEIIKDGYVNLRNSVSQLMNRRPSGIEDQEEDPAIDRLQKALEQLDWVAKARVRLREDGDILTGEAFIEPREDRDLLERMAQARSIVGGVDWRLHDISMVPVRSAEQNDT
ncbi:MAG: cation transporter [Bryobacteraceae bacterium]